MSEQEITLAKAIVYLKAVDDLMTCLGGMSMNDHRKGVSEEKAREIHRLWAEVSNAKDAIEGKQ